jgi:2-polyprenyl-3-methyl-5-hydroxy-6-metoxy-1,4-benzoquinol methylase
MTHADTVRAHFEQPKCYLNGSRHNIQIRAETVKEFARGRLFRRVLDIGCGDGSVSLPLLRPGTHLTLLDMSAAMLSEARAQISPESHQNVDFIHDDFLCAPLIGHYDLILCIGVLAHVSSPAAVIAKMCSLLAAEGSVVAQITDCRHPISRVLRAYGQLRDLVMPSSYGSNLISANELTEMFGRQRLQLVDEYRYSLPLPGMVRVLSEHSLYRITRWLHGHHPRGRNVMMGNEYLCRFTFQA